MRHSLLSTLWRISLLTILIIGVFQTYGYINPQSDSVWDTENIQNFQSAKATNLWSTSIAVTTAIATKSSQLSNKNPETSLYFLPDSIGMNQQERNFLRETMISTNMTIIQEYLNLIKTDIPVTLASSNNKKTTIETFISQLELRYKNAALSSQALGWQREKLITNLELLQNKVDALKQKMNGDFAIFDDSASIKNVENYLELKKEYQANYVDVIFINQFLKQYAFLNNYNKKLLDTLINNKEALVNQSFVVIPSSWDEFLKTFNLIYDEAEYKTLQAAEQNK